MNYSFLGQDLHGIADRAKQYFSEHYGARKFQCEKSINNDLPLTPTWHATLNAGYLLCIEVRETPFSNSLYEFVSRCAACGMPVRLWVAVPHGAVGPNFNSELKQARDAGVGVIQISENGSAYEFHRPVPLSLFALKKTDFTTVPRAQREEVKTAESLFLDGTPDQGCQSLCQALERFTRNFAEYSYNQGWWKQPQSPKPLAPKFFQRDPWAKVLKELENGVDVSKVQAKCPAFTAQVIVAARGHTEWRNAVSHKPKSLKQLQDRDARLRTMFEATRDHLIEWYRVCKPLKLVK